VSEPATDGETVDGGTGADDRHHAFISYARRPTDQRFVDELCRELETRGKRVWVDRSDIPRGRTGWPESRRGLRGRRR